MALGVLLFQNVKASEVRNLFSQGATTHGIGLSGRASVIASEAVMLNPAALSAFQGYYLTGLARTYQYSPDVTARTLGFSLSDNTKTQLFPAAINYTNTITTDGFEKRNYYVGSAVRIGRDIAFGASIRRIESDVQREVSNHMDFDLGLLYSINSQMALGLVIQQAGGGKASIGAHRTYALAFSGGYADFFRYHFDVVGLSYRNKDIFMASLGIESQLNDYLILRAGTLQSATPDPTLELGEASVGVGFVGPRLAVNYSVSQALYRSLPQQLEHRFDLTLPFW